MITMSDNTTRRFIKQLIQSNTPSSIKDVVKAISEANSKLLQKQCITTNLKIEKELRMCEIRRCKITLLYFKGKT